MEDVNQHIYADMQPRSTEMENKFLSKRAKHKKE